MTTERSQYKTLVLSATGIIRNKLHQGIKNDGEIQLNAKNNITAIGALAVPVLRCSFLIFNWRLEDTRKSDRRTRAILKLFTLHHPEADVDRLYVKRKEGGRGVL